MQERRRKYKFLDISEKAIAEARAKGITDEEELKQIGADARRQEIFKIGRETEQRFLDFMKGKKGIKNIEDTNHKEDIEDGFDRWIIFDESVRLPDLPVQIKSSWNDVRAFKNGALFKKRDGMILVLNTGPSITQERFDKEYDEELKRINKILVDKKVRVY